MRVRPVRGHPWRWASLACLAGVITVLVTAPAAFPVGVLLLGASTACLLIDRATDRP
jgi:hypothetical protein